MSFQPLLSRTCKDFWLSNLSYTMQVWQQCKSHRQNLLKRRCDGLCFGAEEVIGKLGRFEKALSRIGWI